MMGGTLDRNSETLESKGEQSVRETISKWPPGQPTVAPRMQFMQLVLLSLSAAHGHCGAMLQRVGLGVMSIEVMRYKDGRYPAS
jgi:hypothetical protein